MKLSLSLKLGILVVALFGAVAAGMFLYQPLRYVWLKSKLLSDDKTTRDAAIKTLAGEPNISIPRIIEWLGSGENRLLVLCCSIIQEMDRDRRRQVTGEVSMLLDSASPSVADAAWETLLKENEEKERYTYWTTVDRLRSYYRYMIRRPPAEDADEWSHFDRVRFTYKITRLGERNCIDPLLKALTYDYGNATSTVHEAIVYALGYVGDAGVTDTVLRCLRESKSEEVRCEAALTLGRLGDLSAVDALIEVLRKDEEYIVRAAAAESLGMLRAPQAIDSLVNCFYLGDSGFHDEPYQSCVWALSEIGSEEVVKALTAILESKSENAPYWFAAYTLGFIDEDRTNDLLLGLTRSNQDITWVVSAETLIKRGDKRILPEILGVLKQLLEPDGEIEDEWAAGEAMLLLGMHGGDEAVDLLCRLLRKYLRTDYSMETRDLCYQAARALGEAGDPRAVDTLLSVFDYKEHPIAANFAAKSLIKLANRIPADKLIEAYEKAVKNVSPGVLREDPSECVPDYLLKALGATGDAKALRLLLEKFKGKGWSFETLIALLNFETPEVKDLLRRLHKDEVPLAAAGLLWIGEPVSPKVLHFSGAYLGRSQLSKLRAWRDPDIFFDGNQDLASELFYATEARWGKKRGLEWILNGLLTCPPEMIVFNRKIFERMPEGFPGFEFSARYPVRVKQRKAVLDWLEKHKARLAWDTKKRTYYLKP